jgi:hypothetical protein
MSFLLREVLLGALGIESDLSWGTSKEELSAIDLELIPPSAGALIAKITDLGNVYRFLEESTENQQANPFCQALYDSIESYLDQYRAAILKADAEIQSGLLTTLTGLVAYLEPFQHELQFVGRILPPLITATPLAMLNKMHEYVVVSPPSIAAKLAAFELAIHQVAVNQLTGFLFYRQLLPDLFERSGARVIWAQSLAVTFIPSQIAELLLLIVNVADHCGELFNDSEPPEFDQLLPWVVFMSKTSSTLLASQLTIQWPNFFRGLRSWWMVGRVDFIRQLSEKLLTPFVSSYDLNVLVSALSPEFNFTLELGPAGVTIRAKLTPPLDLIVTDEHQAVLGELFTLLIKLALAEESAIQLWQALKRQPRIFRFIGFVLQILSLIKEFVVFVVIAPAIARIERAGREITDFLRFQGEFASFVLQLAATFPAASPDLQHAVGLISDKTVEMRELLIGKELLKKMAFGQLMDLAVDVGREISAGASAIGAVLGAGDESGVSIGPRLAKLVGALGRTIHRTEPGC